MGVAGSWLFGIWRWPVLLTSADGGLGGDWELSSSVKIRAAAPPAAARQIACLFSRVPDPGGRGRPAPSLFQSITFISSGAVVWWSRWGPWEATHVASQRVQEGFVVAQKSFFSFHFTRGRDIVFHVRTRCQTDSFFIFSSGEGFFFGRGSGQECATKTKWDAGLERDAGSVERVAAAE